MLLPLLKLSVSQTIFNELGILHVNVCSPDVHVSTHVLYYTLVHVYLLSILHICAYVYLGSILHTSTHVYLRCILHNCTYEYSSFIYDTIAHPRTCTHLLSFSSHTSAHAYLHSLLYTQGWWCCPLRCGTLRCRGWMQTVPLRVDWSNGILCLHRSPPATHCQSHALVTSFAQRDFISGQFLPHWRSNVLQTSSFAN